MFANLKRKFNLRQKHSSWSREPYYELVEKYLPADNASLLIDIGSGEGGFVDYLELSKKYDNVFLLDSSEKTVKKLHSKYKHVELYKAPERLPFNNEVASLVHSSHMIEHLYSADLHLFLQEVDRVLSPGGILVVSAPLMWDAFYNDLSHIKPYNPDVLVNYLCSGAGERSLDVISTDYQVQELVYRKHAAKPYMAWGSEIFWVDVALQCIKWSFEKLKIRVFVNNGYTLVLRKIPAQAEH